MELSAYSEKQKSWKASTGVFVDFGEPFSATLTITKEALILQVTSWITGETQTTSTGNDAWPFWGIGWFSYPYFGGRASAPTEIVLDLHVKIAY